MLIFGGVALGQFPQSTSQVARCVPKRPRSARSAALPRLGRRVMRVMVGVPWGEEVSLEESRWNWMELVGTWEFLELELSSELILKWCYLHFQDAWSLYWRACKHRTSAWHGWDVVWWPLWNIVKNKESLKILRVVCRLCWREWDVYVYQ